MSETGEVIRRLRRPLFRKRKAKVPTLKSKVTTLQRKIRNAEAPFNISTDNNINDDIFTTPVVEALDVAANLPSTATTTKTLLKRVQVSGQIVLTTPTATTEIARVVVVLDKRKFDNNTAPVWLDIFNTANVYSMRADTLGGDKLKSFQVLYDRTISVTNDTATLNSHKLFKFSKTWKIPIEQYNYDEYSKNLLYIMYMSTSATTEMDLSYENSVLMSRDN